MVALLLAAGLGMATWGARVALQAAKGIVPGRTIYGAGDCVVSVLQLAVSVCSVYLTRAMPLRAVGALAGGMPVAAAMMIKFKLGYSIGWWLSRFTGDPNPMSLFSPAFFLSIAIAGAAYLLVGWRVRRRFGWAGLTVFIVALSGLFALQDRFLWDPALNIVTTGMYPLLTDTALWAVGFALGYAVMHLIAGPARDDAFVGKS